ncbi:MAG: TadE family protein [Candidatus Solibacter sp.]|jgi:Flp pilus assembly protein TadG|nr:TadE family protein [Candidatus Solibacter sp.]
MMRRAKTSRSGSVMIEFTLSLSFLIPMFLGVWTFGYAFYQYSQLENAVRTGARYASLQTYDSASTTPSSSFLSAVQKTTVYGDPSANTSTATPVVSGLTTSNVQLTVTFASGAPSTMTVSVTNFPLKTYLGSVTLTNKPYVWFPYLGTFGPP